MSSISAKDKTETKLFLLHFYIRVIIRLKYSLFFVMFITINKRIMIHSIAQLAKNPLQAADITGYKGQY